MKAQNPNHRTAREVPQILKMPLDCPPIHLIVFPSLSPPHMQKHQLPHTHAHRPHSPTIADTSQALLLRSSIFNTVITELTSSGVRAPRVHLVTVTCLVCGPWAHSFTAPSLSLLIWKMGTVISTSTTPGCCVGSVRLCMWVQCRCVSSARCLIHSIRSGR